MPTEFFQYLVNRVRPDFYNFVEPIEPLYEPWGRSLYFFSFQLVIGTERAMLIDTGYAMGNVPALVKKYTDLPVTLLITHNHLDHVRAAHHFDDVYMSEYELLPDEKASFNWKNVKDGDVFDLGGIVLEAVLVPGHTRGSMCLIDKKNKVLYTGDAINKLPYIFSPHGTSLEEYHESLLRVKEMTDKDYKMWCGHTWHAYPYEVLLDSITACEEVLAGKTEKDWGYRSPFESAGPIVPDVFEHICGSTRLIYSRKRLRRDQV